MSECRPVEILRPLNVMFTLISVNIISDIIA